MALILLVEDDELVRDVTAEMLRDLGHEVMEANSAESAMPLIVDRQVQILITDIGLPGTSGEVFAAEAAAARAGLRTIFVTGGNAVRDVSDHGSGPVLLRKPYSRDALADALHRVT